MPLPGAPDASRESEFFYEGFGVSAVSVSFRKTRRRELLRKRIGKTANTLEKSVRLRRKRNQRVGSAFPREKFRVGDQFFPDSAILIKRLNVNAAHFENARSVRKLA